MQLSKDEMTLILNMFDQVTVKGLPTMGAVMQLSARLSEALKENPAPRIPPKQPNKRKPAPAKGAQKK
jgi:hypothetical protein